MADVNELLKFETIDFANKCFEIYKQNIDTSIKKTYEMIYEKIESEIKNNIIQKMSGVELFNYSDIFYVKDYNNIIKNIVEPILIEINKLNSYNISKIANQNFNTFFNFHRDEKLVVCSKQICKSTSHNDPIWYTCYTFLTTHGKLLSCIHSNDKIHNTITFYNIDIKIPKDYIKIIQSLTMNSYCTDCLEYGKFKIAHYSHSLGVLQTKCEQHKNDNMIQLNNLEKINIYNIRDKTDGTLEFQLIKDILDYIKETMYNRKIVPLYLKEIIDENIDLKSKYDDFEKQSKLFFEFKDKYEKEIQPFLDICKEKEKLIKLKENILQEKRQLSIIKSKLDAEKQALEIEKEKIYLLNIDEMLKIDEEECCICLEKTSQKLGCGHFIHLDCFKEQGKMICPVCRQLNII
jgi:hypothetical protein